MSSRFTRRGFLTGCSAAIAGLAGSRFNTVAFGDPLLNQEILVYIFLRGGLDGLSLVPPIAGVDRGHYEAARPTLQVPVTGPGAALNLDGQFGLHPSAAPLHSLYQNGNLAIIQAAGIKDLVNKSHFDAMQFVELGTPGFKSTTTGWMTRHLSSAANLPANPVMPSLAIGDLQPQSLLGSLQSVNLADPAEFDIDNGPWLWRNAQRTALRAMYQGSTSWLHDAGVQALDAVDIVQLNVQGGYTPANGAVYPSGTFGDNMRTLAQMVKLDLGLQVATIDLGGFDTHDAQGTAVGGFLATLLAELSEGLAAFYTDLDGAGATNYTQRLTVVVQSEFGRELPENNNEGTEHGYGNLMMVLSGNAVGGVHGNWPGLALGALTDGTDVTVTTDYRQVLSEILIRRMCNPQLGQIFPGLTEYTPLGIVTGANLTPVFGNEIFRDGFENGDLGGWSSQV